MHPSIPIHYFPRHRRLLARIKRRAIDFCGLMLAGSLLLMFATFGGHS